VAFLQDARHHASRARAFADVDRETFVRSATPVEAMYQLLIVGEDLRNIPTHIRSLAPAIPWRLVIGMRDILIHRYWRVDLATVHRVLTEELPTLTNEVDALIESLRPGQQ
jgi:uncharacterized protein with HEPN domain